MNGTRSALNLTAFRILIPGAASVVRAQHKNLMDDRNLHADKPVPMSLSNSPTALLSHFAVRAVANRTDHRSSCPIQFP